jgi:hypothetical protein
MDSNIFYPSCTQEVALYRKSDKTSLTSQSNDNTYALRCNDYFL